ncbi:MAG: hypothetical protein U0263_26615 [Polyangiaceae bacterium]
MQRPSASVLAPEVNARMRRRRPRFAWRWLLLSVFAPGVFCEQLGFRVASEALVWTSLAALVACGALLWQLARPLERTLWCWLLLAVFIIGYYAKFWAFAQSLGVRGGALGKELAWVTPSDLVRALETTTRAFIAFCITAMVLLRVDDADTQQLPVRVPRPDVSIHSRILTILAVMLIGGVATSIAPLAFGFGQMGLDVQALPYRLDALVTRFRIHLLPTALVFVMWLCEHPSRRRLRMLAMGCLLGFALVDSVIRTSRGSVLFFCASALLMWLLMRQWTAARKWFTAAIVGLTVALYPFFTQLRKLRMQEEQFSAQQLTSGVESSSEGNSGLDALSNVTTRVSGLDGLLHVLRYEGGSDSSVNFKRAELVFDHRGMTNFMTYNIVGIPESYVEGRPPGVLGGFVIAGGTGGMYLFLILYTVAAWWGWRAIARLSIAPVALGFFGQTLFLYTSEGRLGVQDPVAWGVTLLVLWGFQRYAAPGMSRDADMALRRGVKV